LIKVPSSRSLLSLSLAAAAIALTLPAQAGPSTPTKTTVKQIAWRSQLKPALAEAKRSGKPVLLYIYSDSCLPCQEMSKKTYTSAQVVNAASAWIPVKVNGEMDVETAYDYKAESFPKIVCLKPDGSIATESSGFRSAAQVIEAMGAAVKS